MQVERGEEKNGGGGGSATLKLLIYIYIFIHYLSCHAPEVRARVWRIEKEKGLGRGRASHS